MTKYITIVSILESYDDLMTVVALNTNLNKAGTEQFKFELYINGRGYVPKELNDLLPKDKISYMEVTPFDYSLSEILNKSLRRLETAYWCYLPKNILLSDYWLSSSITEINRFQQVGALIINDQKTGFYHHLLTFDNELEQIKIPDIKPEISDLNGVILIERKIIDKVGAFNEQLFSGYEILNYLQRCCINFGNYLIYGKANAQSLKISTENIFQMNKKDYEQLLNSKKLPNYIKLGELSDQIRSAAIAAENLISLPNTWFKEPLRIRINETANNFALEFNCMDASNVKIISNFAKENNLNWNLISAQDKVLCVFTNKNE